MSSSNVLIIGAGWYGCYSALVMKDLGFQVDLIDETNDVFAGSSSKNQNRLHLGFHYPRSHSTRRECFAGFTRFIKEFPQLCSEVHYNAYLVSERSLIDLQTYQNIFRHEGYDVDVVPLAELEAASGCLFNAREIQGGVAILTKERYIDHDAARAYFKERLHHHLKLFDASKLLLDQPQKPRYDGKIYDLALDCTYGQMRTFSDSQHYEACCSLIYKTKRKNKDRTFSITIMDGPFFSIYPYDDKNSLVTLTHVTYTPMMSSRDVRAVKEFCKSLDEQRVTRIKEKMLADVLSYMPNFREEFEYVGYFTSIKTKFEEPGQSDDRSLQVHKTERIMSFCGGKITGIFCIEQHIRDHLDHLAVTQGTALQGSDKSHMSCRCSRISLSG